MASYVIERELEGGSAPGWYFAYLILPVIEPRLHAIECSPCSVKRTIRIVRLIMCSVFKVEAVLEDEAIIDQSKSRYQADVILLFSASFPCTAWLTLSLVKLHSGVQT